jgi:3-phosphoshikimate 1-carboxyvinyltransferase
LQQELYKFGASLEEISAQRYEVKRKTAWNDQSIPVEIETYDDHRMAMAFAPLALIQKINILHPKVVVKSYPRFWEDLVKVGFVTE